MNGIAFLVAFGAGIAGAVSLGTAKSGAVVGVAVSITTIPAAANIGVALALTEWHIAAQSVAMLLTNVIGLVTAEVLTFIVARRVRDAGPAAGRACPGPRRRGPERDRCRQRRGPVDRTPGRSEHGLAYDLFILVLTVYSLVIMVLLVLPLEPATHRLLPWCTTAT